MRLSHPHNDSGTSLAPVSLSCGRHFDPRWYCVWTQPHREHQALAELIAQDWDAYLPLCISRQGHDRNAVVPLFSRYLFVQMVAARDAWGAICRLPGVGGLIRHAYDRPTPLPHGAIEALLSRTSIRSVVDDPGERFEPCSLTVGAAGTVSDGPLAGWSGICTLSAGHRVRLLLQLFGQAREVEFRSASVRPAA
jgi:transcription antitermination factor NusG